MKISYCVTTVPQRRADLLPRTLVGLARVGFDRPHLFVDGERDPESWRREFGLDVTARWPRLRTAGSWCLALAETYILEPGSDLYCVFQDDAVYSANLRAYLEQSLGPRLGGREYWNMFTMSSNRVVRPRGHSGWYRSNQYGRGAVALAFSREGVVALLSSRHMAERPMDAARGWRSVDGGIVCAMGKAGWIEMVHAPSLVQHVGAVSSMGNGPHKPSDMFRGEDFDLLSIPSDAPYLDRPPVEAKLAEPAIAR